MQQYRAIMAGFTASLLCFIGVIISSNATAAGVDWKYFSAFSYFGEPLVCLYNSIGVAKTDDNNLKIWTKCFAARLMDEVDMKKFGDQITIAYVKRKNEQYTLPISRLRVLTDDQKDQYSLTEIVSNLYTRIPKIKFYYEIDCRKTQIRVLEGVVERNGEYLSDEKPTNWSNISPETGPAALAALICPPK
jgi:hypothetical protein